MLVPGVIFALITFGFVVPCVIDIATTPSRYFDLPTKRTWLLVAIAFWAFGAAAWLLVGRRDVQAERLFDDVTARWARSGYARGYRIQPSAGARQAGGRRGRQPIAVPVRFVAPDDNPEFLRELELRIRNRRNEP